MSAIKHVRFQQVTAIAHRSVRSVIPAKPATIRGTLTLAQAKPIISSWLSLNGGCPFGKVLATTVSGLRFRVVRAYISDRHGLMLQLRESWQEDGGEVTQDHSYFASGIESIQL
jgi:hypothetical protein